ncbi:hypothetical protein Ae406Ps2_2676c [Pseudonocardia sp. Ae406_Ps2]|nr:hypothetical protein Ae406Ps2_2676c [Pseudonocardia sp. Ae406_Ps2]OLM24253.1 hypothetical protein Ae706Ps2_2686c [Pseudonocardia sp. Ae706_Ps2]
MARPSGPSELAAESSGWHLVDAPGEPVERAVVAARPGRARPGVPASATNPETALTCSAAYR